MRTGATFDDILKLPSRPPDARLSYGTDRLQFGDLRLPARRGGPSAIVVFIHGGCWESQYDLSHADPLVTAIADLGVAVWSLEYPRIDDPGGGWPGTFLDVGAGVDFVRTLARAYAVDAARAILMGHSAGGHLALWTAARARIPPDSILHAHDPLQVRGVVSLAGITDLEAAYVQRVCDSSVERLMGADPSRGHDRYAHASPSALAPADVPQILVHGSSDTIVPAAFSSSFAEATRARGGSARALIVEGAGHFDVISPRSLAWTVVRDAVLELAE